MERSSIALMPQRLTPIRMKGILQNQLPDDKPEKGGMLFKAGTKERQHIVGIQPNGHGSFYQLVYLAAWGNDEEK